MGLPSINECTDFLRVLNNVSALMFCLYIFVSATTSISLAFPFISFFFLLWKLQLVPFCQSTHKTVFFVFRVFSVLTGGFEDTFTHSFIHSFIHIYMHTHTHIYTYIHTYTSSHTHTHTHSFIHTYIYTYA
jgi:hypothetical protein